MAIQDIVDALIRQTDDAIAAARAAHQQRLAVARATLDADLAQRKADIVRQKEDRKEQLRRKAQSMATGNRKNAVLQAKKDAVDGVFSRLTQDLAAQPDDAIEPLLRACLKQITVSGDLFPASRHAALLKRIAPSERFTIREPIAIDGGFRFVAKDREWDFSFAFLVENVLRPQVELSVSHDLFAA